MLDVDENLCNSSCTNSSSSNSSSGNMTTMKQQEIGSDGNGDGDGGDGGGGDVGGNLRNINAVHTLSPPIISPFSMSPSSPTTSFVNTNDGSNSVEMTTQHHNSCTKSSTPTAPSNVAVVVHYFASFHHICVVTALLPLATLFICFVTAYVFQYDDVHETHCRVYNIVPSISAITGISPQRYFWRLSIALHLGPRIPIAFVYKNYYSAQLQSICSLRPLQVQRINLMIIVILVLNCIEVASLGGVTYVSNRENYPIHEKIFITFMICSLCHMLLTIMLNGILHGNENKLTFQQRESLKWKKILFAMSILSTVGLLIFFAKHRFYCHDLAFSWFAFFEYLIAIANMLFHFTIIWDFPSQYMLVVQGSRTNLEQIFNTTSITTTATPKKNN